MRNVYTLQTTSEYTLIYLGSCYNTNMKLIRTFNITTEEFYNYLEDQLLRDIQKNTKRKVTKKDIHSGYQYENKDANCKITIDTYTRGSTYISTVKSQTSYIRVSYHTQETKDGLQIEFEQFVSDQDDRIQQMNFFARQLHNWVSFGRMSHTLYDMRNAIINKREGIETVNFQQPERHKLLRSFLQKKLNNND